MKSRRVKMLSVQVTFYVKDAKRILRMIVAIGGPCYSKFYIHVTVHHNTFLYNKTNFTHLLQHETTCFSKFLCPSSGVYSLYTQQWYMSYRFVDSFQTGRGWNS
jgi:hypothetical protein